MLIAYPSMWINYLRLHRTATYTHPASISNNYNSNYNNNMKYTQSIIYVHLNSSSFVEIS